MFGNTPLTKTGFDAIGEIVTWTSQSQGTTKTKTGKIVAFVPANEDPRKYFDAAKLGIKPSRIKFDYWTGRVDRYIVAVPRNPNAPDPYAPSNVDYYAPRASWFVGSGIRKPAVSVPAQKKTTPRNTVLTVTGFDAVGQIVTWVSQAQGTAKVKTGRIEAFVPANEDYRRYFDPEKKGIKKSRIKFDYTVALNPRYIVAVPRNPDAPDPYAPDNVDYYAPLASWFEGK